MVNQAQHLSHDETSVNPEWIAAIKARGWAGAFSTALDVLEPLGPLGAQIMWVAQPMFGVIGLRDALGEFANALETPEGIENLRKALADAPADAEPQNANAD